MLSIYRELKAEYAQFKKVKALDQAEKKKKKDKAQKLKKIKKKNTVLFFFLFISFEKGLSKYDKGKFSEAFDIFFYLAEVEKNISAQSALGYMYAHGIGTKQNHKNAVKYFKLAAEQEIPKHYNEGQVNIIKEIIARAELNLAIMYIHGKGVLQDWHKADEYLQRVAKKDYKKAETIWNRYGLTDRQRL